MLPLHPWGSARKDPPGALPPANQAAPIALQLVKEEAMLLRAAMTHLKQPSNLPELMNESRVSLCFRSAYWIQCVTYPVIITEAALMTLLLRCQELSRTAFPVGFGPKGLCNMEALATLATCLDM